MQEDTVVIPKEILGIQDTLSLHIDTIFINGLRFLTSIDEPICYRNCVSVENDTTKEYCSALDKVFRVYNKGGFTIRMIHCDGEYKSLMDEVSDGMNITMNYSNPQDHVPREERNNRTIKEAFRTGFYRAGYRSTPKVMIQELAIQCTKQLNMFPA